MAVPVSKAIALARVLDADPDECAEDRDDDDFDALLPVPPRPSGASDLARGAASRCALSVGYAPRGVFGCVTFNECRLPMSSDVS
jgi:hypothetical protein